ncbi:MAG: 3-deoxy-7-phosphoheptulonate synthase [Deltaproteobacteria bacterium]|nr:3-deoxy-7-phosphoheptulonate synthase [Candidatus Zymogenaceae bacterium]
MILILSKDITKKQKKQLIDTLKTEDCIIREIVGVEETILGLVGQIKRDIRYFETLPGVSKVIPISKPYKLVSTELHPEPSVIHVGDVAIGGDRLVVIAGPCAVESRERTLEIARAVKRHGAVLFRGGAFKPRTSPYSFQGLEAEGLKILAEVREETGMGVVSEMTSPGQADLMMKYVDMVQVGARNMQNFELLKSVGRIGKPVLLKRGLSATIEEWLMAAEYILSEGNDNVILCERGIRTYETYTRNTLDLSAIPVTKKLTHLPVIVDPSHATGLREKVSPMARAAIATGADGLIVEVHTNPEEALSDGPQSLYPQQFEQLMRDLAVIAPVVGKQVDLDYLEKTRSLAALRKKPGETAEIVYRGDPGTASYKACSHFFGEGSFRGIETFREVFEAVKRKDASMGVIPLENSLTGSIHENYDLLLEYDLSIVGELTLRIIHSLIGLPGAKTEDIRRVYSHPQVFERCKEFLDDHPDWELVAAKDVLRGIERVKNNNNPKEAVIGSSEAADISNLVILKEGIETSPQNFTRFVVISDTEKWEGERDKSSLIFAVADKPGALFQSLRVFADQGINMVKLESRAIPHKPWRYLFYVDIELDVTDKKNKSVITLLEKNTDFLKVLGSYRKGTIL